jgi:hypothetical protein
MFIDEIYQRNIRHAHAPNSTMLTPAELKAVLDWAYAHPDSKATRGEADAKFLPDVSKYRDRVYVHLHLDFHRGGSYESHEIMADWELKLLDHFNPEIHLGEVNGKHSEVSLLWRELLRRSETDPYKIARLDEMHKLRDHERTEELLCTLLERLTECAEESFEEYQDIRGPEMSEDGFHCFVAKKSGINVDLMSCSGYEAISEVYVASMSSSNKRSGSDDEEDESAKKKARTDSETEDAPLS